MWLENHPPMLLLDASTATERHFTMRQWREIVSHRGSGGYQPLMLVSSNAGRLDFVFSYVDANPTCYLPVVGFYASVLNLTREAVIENPLFTPFRAEEDAMRSTNQFCIADADYRDMLRAKLLGDAIPATSFLQLEAIQAHYQQ